MAIDPNLPGEIDQTKRRQNAAPASGQQLGMTLTPDQMQEQRRAADMKRAAGRIQQTKESVGKAVSGIADTVGNVYGSVLSAATVVPRGIKRIATGEIPVNVYDRPFDYGDGQRRAAQWMEKNPAQATAAKQQMQDIAGRAVANALPPSPLGMPARPSTLAAAPASSAAGPARAPSSSPAAGSSGSSQPTAPATPGTPQPAVGQQQGNGWGRTGIGTGMQGGEIVGRVGANGIAEFSSAPSEQQAAQGRFSAQQLGFGPTSRPVSGSAPDGARVLASGTNDPNALPRGSIANLGDGNGSFSQGQAGDSRLALDRFERANAERARMVQASRGGIGDTGNFTVVADGTRGSQEDRDMEARRRLKYGTDVAMERNRLEGQQLRQSGINSYLDRELRAREVASAEQTGTLQRQKTSQDLQAGAMELAQQQRVADLRAQLADPNIRGDARQRLQQTYNALATSPGDRLQAEQDSNQQRQKLVADLFKTYSENRPVGEDNKPISFEEWAYPALQMMGIGAKTVPSAAVQDLRASPERAAEFDRKYGAGASARYLGG